MESLFELDSATFNNVLEQIICNLYSTKDISSPHIEQKKIKTAQEDLKNIINDNNFEIPATIEHLKNKGCNQDKLEAVTSILESKKSDLLYTSLLHYNSSYGEAVSDFDCILKLVFGTSELKTLNYPLLQLLLSTINSSGEQSQKLFDLNKEMLDKLINVLESIQIN